jgi:hypothetical protein
MNLKVVKFYIKGNKCSKPTLPSKMISGRFTKPFYFYESVDNFLIKLKEFKEECEIILGREINRDEIIFDCEPGYDGDRDYFICLEYEEDNPHYNLQLEKYNKDIELYKQFLKREFENLK